jgi:hypothetical protein
MVEHIEILVEERSAEEVLRIILPQILGDTSFSIYSHQGKSDLLGKLPGRLQGYSAWLPENYFVAVLVDRDDNQCEDLKRELERIAADAGLFTRSRRAADGRFSVVNRIAVEELEAWFFGDWFAVQSAYPRVPGTIPKKAKYSDSDDIEGGTWEALERIMKRAGYFGTGLRKIEAARAIAAHMEPERNRSGSFQVFRTALTELA